MVYCCPVELLNVERQPKSSLTVTHHLTSRVCILNDSIHGKVWGHGWALGRCDNVQDVNNITRLHTSTAGNAMLHTIAKQGTWEKQACPRQRWQPLARHAGTSCAACWNCKHARAGPCLLAQPLRCHFINLCILLGLVDLPYAAQARPACSNHPAETPQCLLASRRALTLYSWVTAQSRTLSDDLRSSTVNRITRRSPTMLSELTLTKCLLVSEA